MLRLTLSSCGGILFSLLLLCTCQRANSMFLMGGNIEPRDCCGPRPWSRPQHTCKQRGMGQSSEAESEEVAVGLCFQRNDAAGSLDAEDSARKPGRLQLRLRIGAIKL
uniref:Putative secreted protein n=1 Tax=Ixodes ricinus TaxID=34613 RepID=A0A6B0UH35_IXORI